MSLLKRVLPGETSLDETGKALRDRLLRLGAKKSSAYTALSLLKGYSSFKIGACLDSADDGVYKSYALVGLGITKLSIPLAGLLREDQAFFKLPNPETLGLNFVSPDMNLWIFALDDADPCRRLLLAVEENSPAFNPEIIASILAETNEVFFPSGASADSVSEDFDLDLPGETETRETPEPDPAAGRAGRAVPAESPEETTAEGVGAKIAEFQHSNPVFHGILLEIPGGGKTPGAFFAKQVAAMVGVLGASCVLPSGRILVLLPPRFDRELVAHRLSMSFVTEVLSCFEADRPDKALEFIQPYL
ncbi:MAG: hypothetical protein LBU16_10180 [Treponema sp.]|jgi:hypothetical protein|nr:hypothetical protein [Treponema sp.]